MRILSILSIALFTGACAIISGLHPPDVLDRDKGRPDCRWNDWHVYGEKVLDTEETSSVTCLIERGYISRVDVEVTHRISLHVASRLKRECWTGGPEESRPVKIEYRTGDKTWWHPCKDEIVSVDILLGDYIRWELLRKTGEEGRWAVYKGRATFFVSTEGMNITDTPPPEPLKTLILSVNSREASRLYLH